MLNLFYLLLFSFIMLGENAQTALQEPIKAKILFVVSNAEFYGNTDIPASNHFAELVYPYDRLTKAGYEVNFLSPDGGAVALGYFNTSEKIIKDYLYDCEFMAKLAATLSPSEVNAKDYQAIYYGGGGAAMFGVAENTEIQKIAMEIYEDNQGIISALCHGSFGLINLKNQAGEYLVANKNINGFPDIFENTDAKYFKEFSESVEAALKNRGANFKYSEEGWDGYYQTDGRIITGQDPSSAAKVADLIIEKLEK